MRVFVFFVHACESSCSLEGVAHNSWQIPMLLQLIIVLILANCVTLALYNPMVPDDDPWNATLATIGGHEFGTVLQSELESVQQNVFR